MMDMIPLNVVQLPCKGVLKETDWSVVEEGSCGEAKKLTYQQ